MANKIGDLRICWVPSVPGKTFYMKVTDFDMGFTMLNGFARYDLFLFKNSLRTDFENAGRLEIYVSDAGKGKPGWVEWNDTVDNEVSIMEGFDMISLAIH